MPKVITGPLAAIANGHGKFGPQDVVVSVGKLWQLLDNAMVGDHSQVLLVPETIWRQFCNRRSSNSFKDPAWIRTYTLGM